MEVSMLKLVTCPLEELLLQEIECYLEDAGIDVCDQNIEALSGMMSLGIKSPDECVKDLRAYVDLGATWL